MSTGEAPRKTVWVVDDDPTLRDAARTFLEEEGYHVDAAANGQEALDRLQAGERPSLILLDLIMPVLDGWQFRREQLRDPELARLPVVVITAAAVWADVARRNGLPVLRKPFDVSQLLQVVRQYCGA